MIKKITMVFVLSILILIYYHDGHNYLSDSKFQSTFEDDTIIIPKPDTFILNKPNPSALLKSIDKSQQTNNY